MTQAIQASTPSRQMFREDVMGLQHFIQTRNDRLDPDDIPIRHIFAPKVYAREMTLPQGTVVVGKIHRQSNINIISKGTVRFVNESGVFEHTAPYTFVAEAGTKRAIYAVEDVVWTVFHVTDETDLKKIEDDVIAKTYDELDGVITLEKD